MPSFEYKRHMKKLISPTVVLGYNGPAELSFPSKLASEQNSEASTNFATLEHASRRCRPRVITMAIQLMKSALFFFLGLVPGALLVANFGNAFIAVAIFGGLIGLGLSLPGVSLARVSRLTAATIVSHNIPIAGGRAFDAIMGTENELDDASKEAMQKDFHNLRKVDLVKVSDLAAQRMESFRPPELTNLPFRISAEINPSNPYFLLYSLVIEPQWSHRDVYCSSNGIDVVIDEISSKRLAGTNIDWEERADQKGFTFNTPNWPRANLDREPSEDGQDQRSTNTGVSKVGIAGIVGLVLLGFVITALRKGPRIINKAGGEAEQHAPPQPAAQGVNNQTVDLNSKLMQDKDMKEALSILLGNSPSKDKKSENDNPKNQGKADDTEDREK